MSEPKPHLNARVQDACGAAFHAWLRQYGLPTTDQARPMVQAAWITAWNQALRWEATEQQRLSGERHGYPWD